MKGEAWGFYRGDDGGCDGRVMRRGQDGEVMGQDWSRWSCPFRLWAVGSLAPSSVRYFQGMEGAQGPPTPPSPHTCVSLGLPPSSHSCITPSGSHSAGRPPGPKTVAPTMSPPGLPVHRGTPPAASCPRLIPAESRGPQIWNWLPQGALLVRPRL